MKTYTIYIHRNKINNKAYIGQTCWNVKQRWLNGHHYKPCTHFNRAIEKYGWDSFEHIIFATGLSEDEANRMETLLIALFDTRNPDYGYNLRSGGKNSQHSEESKRKMSLAKAKKVYCVELDKVFIGTRAAAEATGANQGTICQVCRGKYKQTNGYHFRYVE